MFLCNKNFVSCVFKNTVKLNWFILCSNCNIFSFVGVRVSVVRDCDQIEDLCFILLQLIAKTFSQGRASIINFAVAQIFLISLMYTIKSRGFDTFPLCALREGPEFMKIRNYLRKLFPVAQIIF